MTGNPPVLVPAPDGPFYNPADLLRRMRVYDGTEPSLPVNIQSAYDDVTDHRRTLARRNINRIRKQRGRPPHPAFDPKRKKNTMTMIRTLTLRCRTCRSGTEHSEVEGTRWTNPDTGRIRIRVACRFCDTEQISSFHPNPVTPPGLGPAPSNPSRRASKFIRRELPASSAASPKLPELRNIVLGTIGG